MNCFVGLVVLPIYLSGCVPDQPTGNTNQEYLLEPRSIALLREQQIGPVTWDLVINDVVFHAGISAGLDDNRITVPIERLDLIANQVDIAFYLDRATGGRQLLASSSVVLPRHLPGDTVTLSGLEYTYSDSDGDGIHDVHEVTITPEDLDNDTLPNFQDTDSDGDLLPDGEDPLPYEGSINNGSGAGSRDFELIQPGGERRTIRIADSNGPTDALDHIINTLGQVTLRSEPGWPETELEDSDLDSRWIAYGIGSGPAAPCPEWRISRDVSAIRSNLTAPALLFFERNDDEPFMASLAVGVVADLDSLDDAQNPIQGRGAWNDALRMIVVSDNTVGWMEINTEAEFAGTGCQLNLSSFIYEN